MNENMPVITGSTYSTTALNMADMLARDGLAMPNHIDQLKANPFIAVHRQEFRNKQGAEMSSARIVKVYIADPNINVPLESRILYSGEEKLTDLTDQELFFEVPITDLLAKHNATRKATVDKTQSEKFGRDIYLEPARIRDLRMVVVAIAQF